MFTGIITGLGQIVHVHDLGTESSHGKRLTLLAPSGYLDDVGLGDSIALNGACMTVTAVDLLAKQFDIEISVESLTKTHGLAQKRWVNLEKALRPMDGTAQVVQFEPTGESWTLRVLAPLELACFLAYKGSVTLNGVSLTINHVLDTPKGVEISINLIAHTLQNTTFKDTRVGDTINIEIDTVARYVHRSRQVELNPSTP